MKSSKFKIGFLSVLCVVIAGSLWYSKDGDASYEKRQAKKAAAAAGGGGGAPIAITAGAVQAAFQAVADNFGPGHVVAAPADNAAVLVEQGRLIAHMNGLGNAQLRRLAAKAGIPAGGNQHGIDISGAQNVIQATTHIVNHIDGAINAAVANLGVAGGPIAFVAGPHTVSSILARMRAGLDNLAFMFVDGYGFDLTQFKNTANGTHAGANLGDGVFDPGARVNPYNSHVPNSAVTAIFQ